MTSTSFNPGTARTLAGTVFTLLAALGFSAVSILTQIATSGGASLSAVLAWRYVLASLILIGWVGFEGKRRRLPVQDTLRWLFIGGGGQALVVWLALSSLAYIKPATLAFLFYTYPTWVALFQVARGSERIDAPRGLALVLSFVGIVLVAGTPQGGADAIKGYALAIGAAVAYALYIPAMAWMQKDWPVTTTTAWAKIGSAVCFVFVAVSDGSFTWNLGVSSWTAILALTVLATVLPSLFFLMGLLRLGPLRTAIVSSVEPFLTALLGMVVLAQPLSAGTAAGGVAIVAAVLLNQRR